MPSTGHSYINRQGTSTGCRQVFKNHVKGEGKNALHFRPIKGTLANGRLLTDHPREMQTQKYLKGYINALFQAIPEKNKCLAEFWSQIWK